MDSVGFVVVKDGYSQASWHIICCKVLQKQLHLQFGSKPKHLQHKSLGHIKMFCKSVLITLTRINFVNALQRLTLTLYLEEYLKSKHT